MLGSRTPNGISRKLGRSYTSIKRKMHRLDICGVKENAGWFTANHLANCMGVTGRTVMNYYKNYDLPFITENFTNISDIPSKYNSYLISSDIFWPWAKKNKEVLDFSKFDPDSLYPVPEWFYEERKKDQKTPPPFSRRPWTDEEDETVLHYFYKEAMTQKDISVKMGRTVNGISNRLRRLRRDTMKGSDTE